MAVTRDGVVVSAPQIVDVSIECRGCDLFVVDNGADGRGRLASQARRHAGKTGHKVAMLRQVHTVYKAER
jgi:hypothetical protein